MSQDNQQTPQPKVSARERSGRFVKEITEPGLVHPALIPGIGISGNDKRYATNWVVLGIAGVVTIAFILWGVIAREQVGEVSQASLSWVLTNAGWLFSLTAILVLLYMLWVGFSARGRIPLGQDGEKPEFSRFSWLAMLFSAGMGIGLLFFGTYEPLYFYVAEIPGVDATTMSEKMHAALAQSLFHWGPLAWGLYALVGGAIAYSAYRRGRLPLVSSVFESVFGKKTQGPLGTTIDIFAIIVTLFGTAMSLGLGALQIGKGIQAVGNTGEIGSEVIVGIILVLTAAFIASAVSGVKRGIRALSNINMVIAGLLAVFIFIVGPTLFFLNIMPTMVSSFIGDFSEMLTRSAADGPEMEKFLGSWTIYYWAWWISWTPFVGLFIAKISRGRSLREFVLVVIAVPSAVSAIWFAIFGGGAIWLQDQGRIAFDPVNTASDSVLFSVLGELPWGTITSIAAMISIVIFFVTSADSASIVMASMSQRGRPEPSAWITVMWGLILAGIAITLLLVGGGGTSALQTFQQLVIVSALPFVVVMLGIMVAWTKDLNKDPYMLRRKYTVAALDEGIRQGIEQHGDDFAFSAAEVEPEKGAGAWLDSEDPSLTEWYEDASSVIEASEAEAAEAEAAVEIEAEASNKT